MNKFKKIAILIIVIQLLMIGVINIATLSGQKQTSGQYRVDVKRVTRCLIDGQEVNLDDYKYVTGVKSFDDDYITNSEYAVVYANGKTYAIEYYTQKDNNYLIYMNVGMALMLITTISVLVYVNKKVMKPFHNMSDMTVELAKGNLSTPIKEDKNKFFGKFLWGMDMLRDNLETNREKELQLQKEKKTLILSLSHDIKTPLSAIKLYTKALSDGLYDTEEKKSEALDGISRNTVQIENYVSEIVNASKEDFLNLEVNIGEFYLSEVMDKIDELYSDKFTHLHTEFKIDNYNNCILRGDKDRLEEVIQNLLENAIKYGDGKQVRIRFDEEEDCQLIKVNNSGCTIEESELPHLFESFYRGTNVKNKEGSGLGLYIAKSLMHLMDGEVYTQIDSDEFIAVVVARKA